MIFQKVGPIGFFEFQRVVNLDLWPLVFYNPKMLFNKDWEFWFFQKLAQMVSVEFQMVAMLDVYK